jgi:hypothetical protein
VSNSELLDGLVVSDTLKSRMRSPLTVMHGRPHLQPGFIAPPWEHEVAAERPSGARTEVVKAGRSVRSGRAVGF